MWASIGYGLTTGFVMSVSLGVVFFMLIQAGLIGGIRKGLPIALGVISGDLIFVALAVKFSGYLKGFLETFYDYWFLLGGVVFCVLGLGYLLNKYREQHDESESKIAQMSASQLWLRAFLINIANPANLTWWIGLFSLPPAIYFTAVNQWIFGISAVASIFITEVAIAWGSGKVKSLLNEQFMKRLNTGMGVLFMGIGVYMIVSVLV